MLAVRAVTGSASRSRPPAATKPGRRDAGPVPSRQTGARDTTPQVIASPGVPAIGPGHRLAHPLQPARRNGPAFPGDANVTAAVHADGPSLTARITTPEGAVMNAKGGGAVATSWALSPGWYTLVLTPETRRRRSSRPHARPPGLIPPTPEPPGPEAPVLAFGEQTVDATLSLAVLVNRVPDAEARLLARPVPAELADGPLVETLPAGVPGSFEVHAHTAGMLTLRDVAGGAPLESRSIEAGAQTSLDPPPSDRAEPGRGGAADASRGDAGTGRGAGHDGVAGRVDRVPGHWAATPRPALP